MCKSTPVGSCCVYLQVLIQVSMDLTLCLLSLLMSETPTAMSHLLQAIGSLHETGHVFVMQGLLQLFLPQGNTPHSRHLSVVSTLVSSKGYFVCWLP